MCFKSNAATMLEHWVGDLTDAALPVALRHHVLGNSVDVELFVGHVVERAVRSVADSADATNWPSRWRIASTRRLCGAALRVVPRSASGPLACPASSRRLSGGILPRRVQ